MSDESKEAREWLAKQNVKHYFQDDDDDGLAPMLSEDCVEDLLAAYAASEREKWEHDLEFEIVALKTHMEALGIVAEQHTPNETVYRNALADTEREKREQVEHQLEQCQEHARAAINNAEQVEAANAKLREGLKPFAGHTNMCKVFGMWRSPHYEYKWRDGDEADCTCGLAALLADSERKVSK